MHWKLTTYQNNKLLKTLAALLLLFSVSYSPIQENTARQLFQSETLHTSKNKNLERKAISYEKASRLGIFDSEKRNNLPIFSNRIAAHNAEVKVQVTLRDKQYHSFKSGLQFFIIKMIADNPDEESSIS